MEEKADIQSLHSFPTIAVGILDLIHIQGNIDVANGQIYAQLLQVSSKLSTDKG